MVPWKLKELKQHFFLIFLLRPKNEDFIYRTGTRISTGTYGPRDESVGTVLRLFSCYLYDLELEIRVHNTVWVTLPLFD